LLKTTTKRSSTTPGPWGRKIRQKVLKNRGGESINEPNKNGWEKGRHLKTHNHKRVKEGGRIFQSGQGQQCDVAGDAGKKKRFLERGGSTSRWGGKKTATRWRTGSAKKKKTKQKKKKKKKGNCPGPCCKTDRKTAAKSKTALKN